MGGSARKWSKVIAADASPGKTIQLRLVMTKFGPPSVRIGYEISMEPAP